MLQSTFCEAVGKFGNIFCYSFEYTRLISKVSLFETEIRHRASWKLKGKSQIAIHKHKAKPWQNMGYV